MKAVLERVRVLEKSILDRLPLNALALGDKTLSALDFRTVMKRVEERNDLEQLQYKFFFKRIFSNLNDTELEDWLSGIEGLRGPCSYPDCEEVFFSRRELLLHETGAHKHLISFDDAYSSVEKPEVLSDEQKIEVGDLMERRHDGVRTFDVTELMLRDNCRVMTK